MPWVTIARATGDPTAARRSHSVSRPDLAVGVHLGPDAVDPAEVAVGVAAGARQPGARTLRDAAAPTGQSRPCVRIEWGTESM